MVDGVLVINLDRRADRWEKVREVTAGLVPEEKLQRLSAVVGADLPGFGAYPWFRGRKRDATWAGRAGCLLSHRLAISHARERGWRNLLILEDDIEPTPQAAQVLAALADALASTDWQVCYLGFTDPVPPFRTVAELTPEHQLVEVSGASTTHAYLVRSDAFDWLLRELPDADAVWPWVSRHRAIDRWYYRNLSRRLRVLAVSPSLINQEHGFSDITQRMHEDVHATRVGPRRHSRAVFAFMMALRRLRWRLAEPRDWLRGRLKRAKGF
jgi:GR25 family glycosyltransferase involved in LPS biosynthesis